MDTSQVEAGVTNIMAAWAVDQEVFYIFWFAWAPFASLWLLLGCPLGSLELDTNIATPAEGSKREKKQAGEAQKEEDGKVREHTCSLCTNCQWVN